MALFTYGRGQSQTPRGTRGAAIGGSARTPRVGTTRSDLEAQAEQNGWSPRELKYADIEAMSSAEMRYHEVCNSANLEAAFERHNNIQDDEQHQQYWNIKKKWTGMDAASEDDKAKMRDVAERFFQLYPQVIRDNTNAQIWDYMKEKNLPPTDIASPIRAFEELAQQGKVSVNPSAISAGTETNISGIELTSHRHFHLLLQSHRRPTAEESMSATQYAELHPEVKSDAGIPPLIQARMAKQKATEQFIQQTEAATSRSGGMTLTDYKRK